MAAFLSFIFLVVKELEEEDSAGNSSISSIFLFLVMNDEEEDSAGKSDSEVGGKLMEDETTTSETGAKEARSSAAEAELKVARPFPFLSGGSSLGSHEITVALGPELKLASFRVVLCFLDKGDCSYFDVSDVGIDGKHEMDHSEVARPFPFLAGDFSFCSREIALGPLA